MKMTGQTITKFIAHERYVGYSDATVDRRQGTAIRWMRHIEEQGIELPATGDDVIGFLGQHSSPQTRASYLSDLRRLYSWAIVRGIAQGDPTVDVETPRIPPGEPKPLTAGEVSSVRSACRDQQDRLVVSLGLCAGLRVSEMAKLELGDVLRQERLLIIRNAKGGKTRRVPLATALEHQLRYGVVHAVTGHGVTQRINRIFRRAGVTRKPHSLRHTFGTEYMRRGGDLQALAEIMGHTNLATTRLYAKYYPRGWDIVDSFQAA